MADVWHDGKDIIVSLSSQGKGYGQYTEYANVDLASGYPSNQIWTTKDGRRIAIPNLSDNHLLNIVAYLRRRSEDYRKFVIAQIAQGVMEATVITRLFDVPDYLEEEYDDFIEEQKAEAKIWFDMEPEQLLRKVVPIYSQLLQEAYRRKLLIEVDASKLDNGDET